MTWLGALIALAAALANAFALVLQAQEARRSSEDDAAHFRLLWRLAHNPAWVLGTVLLIIAWPLQIVSLAFAPLTVVQPVLASFQLILLLITRLWLRRAVGARQWAGASAVTLGIVMVLLAAPHRQLIHHPQAGRLAIPLTVVGVGVLLTFVAGRTGRRGLVLAAGAALGYAWVDFADKIVANAFSAGRTFTGFVWLAAIACCGGVAFVLENSALQRRAATAVAPVVAVIQEPLPVLMALAAGLEIWHGGPLRLAVLAAGIAIAGTGAVTIAHAGTPLSN